MPPPAMQIAQQEPKPPEPQEEFLNIESSPEPDNVKENETEQTRSGGNLGGGAAVGIGLLIAIGIAWWLKNRK